MKKDYRRADAAQLRDARATRDDSVERPRPAKKDTRKWCKGVVGREHNPAWQERKARWGNSLWMDFVCDNCKKVLDTWWHRGGPKPEVGSREPLKR